MFSKITTLIAYVSSVDAACAIFVNCMRIWCGIGAGNLVGGALSLVATCVFFSVICGCIVTVYYCNAFSFVCYEMEGQQNLM